MDQDYIGFLANRTFPPGSEPGTQVSVNVTIIDDTLEEGVERIFVLAAGLNPGNLGTTTILVTDNDCKFY